MINVLDLLTKAEAIIVAVEVKAPDALDKAADWLSALSDNVRGLKVLIPSGPVLMKAGVEDKCEEKADELQKRLEAFRSGGEHNPKGFGLPGNPILVMILQLLAQFLAGIKTQTDVPKPPTM